MEPKQIAEDILFQRFSHPVRLAAGKELRGSGRAHVYRFSVLAGQPEAPETVIVKLAAQPYGATFHGAVDGNVWHEWAGMQLITAVPSDHTIAPECYGGSQPAGLIVLEDLGDGPSLRDLMAGDNSAQAEDALVNFFATLGKLHARTHGHQALFHDIRNALGPYHPERDWHQCRYARTIPSFHELLQLAQISPAPGTDADLAAVVAMLTNPGFFQVYIHGDPTPSNCLFSKTTPRLIDFEYGTFGLALLDGVQARLPFPTGPFVNRIPTHITRRAEAVYRAELLRGCPEAADDVLFHQAVVAACAYWAISFLSWLSFADLLVADRQWGIASVRQRVVLFSEIVAHTAEELGYLEALGSTFKLLAAKLQTMWPEAAGSMPLYPAFR